MGKELRREPRVPTTFELNLETAGLSGTYTTLNASFKGVFVMTEEPLPLRRLVRIRAEVDGVDVEMLGVVAHTLNAVDAHDANKQPGMGIALFGLGPAQRQHWNDFVRSEYEKDPDAHAALMAAELPRLRLHLKNDKMKERFFGTDLPSGEIFYRTTELFPEGSRLCCEIKHPDTGKTLELVATVVEVVEGSRRKRGIRVAFDELSEASTHRLDRFERGELSEASVGTDELSQAAMSEAAMSEAGMSKTSQDEAN